MGFIETVQQIIIDAGSGCELSWNALQSQILLPTKLVKNFNCFKALISDPSSAPTPCIDVLSDAKYSYM